MRKKLALLLFVLVTLVAGAVAGLTAPPTQAAGCPKGTHLFVCPYGSFCCPNNAFCACLQFPPN